MTEVDFYRFKQLLRQRGETLAGLAEKAGVARCHVGAILRGTNNRGKHTRKHIAKCLLAEELRLVGWDEFVESE